MQGRLGMVNGHRLSSPFVRERLLPCRWAVVQGAADDGPSTRKLQCSGHRAVSLGDRGETIIVPLVEWSPTAEDVSPQQEQSVGVLHNPEPGHEELDPLAERDLDGLVHRPHIRGRLCRPSCREAATVASDHASDR